MSPGPRAIQPGMREKLARSGGLWHDFAQTMLAAEALNRRELGRYVQRVDDRWPLRRALLGGARVDDARGLGSQRERGPEYVLVLVSEGFDGVPWLERVYQAGALWDAAEMGGPAEVHCYTPPEFERKSAALPAIRGALEHGVDLLAG